jgi:hypothetical protein
MKRLTITREDTYYRMYFLHIHRGMPFSTYYDEPGYLSEEVKATLRTKAEAERARIITAIQHEKDVVEAEAKLLTFMVKGGRSIKMRSKPEVKLANYFTYKGIAFEYEPKLFKKLGINYTPDFYLPKYNLFIEVKAHGGMDYYQDAKVKQLAKIKTIRSKGYSIAYMAAEDITAELN